LPETSLKSTDKTGVMVVSRDIGNLFDLDLSGGKQLSRSAQPLLRDQVSDVHSGFLLKQALEIGRT
jgi:hypothetical protein